MTTFTIEASPGDRVSVSWETEIGEPCYFMAKHDGRQITDLEGSMRTGSKPVVYRHSGIGRGSMRYDDALTYAAVILEAKAQIAAGDLIAKAVIIRNAERAENAARLKAEKAATVRAALNRAGISPATLSGIADGNLANAYDEIQGGL